MHEPTPEQYSPPLTWRSHLWRVLAMVALSAALWVPTVGLQWRQSPLLVWLDVGSGLLALGLSFFRRRWPLAVALVTNVLGAVSITSAGPGVLAAVSLATRRVLWQVVLVGAVSMTGAMVFAGLEPSADDNPWWVDTAFGLAATVATLVWGLYVGSRRELMWTLRDRVHRAEAEQDLRVSQARAKERARIAREMHDVLAHRISLVTMHAGALAYRTDLSAEEVRETAELIQTKSHEALTDLRQVLGVLRSDDPASAEEPPQPSYADLRALVHEAELSGMRVHYDDRVDAAADMPEPVGRATYRIVQEGLTNARKHAPGTAVLVHVAGSPDQGVRIRVRNPAGARNGVAPPGAGLGLVGLQERATLAGGHVDGSRRDGMFELDGWLPWRP